VEGDPQPCSVKQKPEKVLREIIKGQITTKWNRQSPLSGRGEEGDPWRKGSQLWVTLKLSGPRLLSSCLITQSQARVIKALLCNCPTVSDNCSVLLSSRKLCCPLRLKTEKEPVIALWMGSFSVRGEHNSQRYHFEGWASVISGRSYRDQRTVSLSAPFLSAIKQATAYRAPVTESVQECQR
jgi:hypothetical protein